MRKIYLRVSERLAALVIQSAGVSTILAVVLVVLVLVAQTLPLFRLARVDTAQQRSFLVGERSLIHVGSDEHARVFWGVDQQGCFFALDASQGKWLGPYRLPKGSSPEATLRCAKTADDGRSILLGFSDGTLQLFELRSHNDSLPFADPAGDQLALRSDEERTTDRDLLTFRLRSQWSLGEPIECMDFGHRKIRTMEPQTKTSLLWAVCTDRTLIRFSQSEWGRFDSTQESSATRDSMQRVPLALAGSAKAVGVMLQPHSDHVVLATDQGKILRYRFGEGSEPNLVDQLTVEADGMHDNATLVRSASGLLGRETLLLALSGGAVEGYFQSQADESSDWASKLTLAYRIGPSFTEGKASDGAYLATSPVLRILSRMNEAGEGELLYAPTQSRLASWKIEVASPLRHVAFSPRGDHLLILDSQSLHAVPVDVRHPEGSWKGLLAPLWYEGYPHRVWTWQSSSIGQASEPKLSLIPLLWGTLKATFFALAFGGPIALLAAVYTSEFAPRRYRNGIKASVEWMASVPSVVLGALGAFVLAPLLSQYLFVLIFVAIGFPLGLYLFAQLSFARRGTNRARLPWMGMVSLAGWGIFLGLLVFGAGRLESWLFGVPFSEWLTEAKGSSLAGWILVLGPLTGFALLVLLESLDQRWLHLLPDAHWLGVVLANPWLRYLGWGLTSCLLTYFLAWNGDGWLGDLRLGILGSYQDRNALLAGMILGFCVIPGIFTLAEDAMQSVPQSLRAASLGCGASPWQTTLYVVIPSAMGGIFAACMVGFSRAIGETMILLMVAGNAPMLDLHPFHGVRTIASTIAIELTEAANGSTHYHVLFLSALCLIGMTLCANSLAEWVRLRLRNEESSK